ncbi:MAG: HAD domain-containing protein [Actinomycetota bacterium]|nr:HAD domain-containing protein [Actinomycetota bacterium]
MAPDELFRLVRVKGQLVRVRAGAGQEEIEAALAEREARAEATAALAGLPASFVQNDPRPLLLVDVDGVVCPYAGELVDPAAAGLEQATVGYSRVWLSRDIAEYLRRLGESFQLVWCTAWEDHAAEFLAPLLGLPALPVIHFDEPVMEDCHWKWPAIEAFVGDRAFGWLDDEIGRDDLARARRRPAPTMLVQVEGTHGLADVHVEQLERFADAVRASPGPAA